MHENRSQINKYRIYVVLTQVIEIIKQTTYKMIILAYYRFIRRLIGERLVLLALDEALEA